MVKLWDAETGENLLTLQGHSGYVETVKFSPDGHHLVSASRDRTVRLWNIAGHTGVVNSVAFGPDGETLATGGSDRTAIIWDVSGNYPRLRHTLRGHIDQVYRVAFGAEGKRLATAGFDNRVKLWDVKSGTEIENFEKHVDQLRDVAFSADGRYLASGGADGYAWLYDLESGDPEASAIRVKHFEGDDWAQVSAVAFRPGTGEWASAGYDGRARLWSLSGEDLGAIETPIPEGQTKRPFLLGLAFSPDGSTVVGLARKWVFLWPVSAFRDAQSEPDSVLTIEDTGFCRGLAYSRDGSRIAVGCNDARVRLFDPAGRRLVKTMKVHQNAVTDVAFSPDADELATASMDKTFHVSPLRFEALYEAARRLRSAIADDGE
jgi:WD40 repeat protein